MLDISPGFANYLGSMVILISSVASVGAPSPTWADVYRCTDTAGKPVLTNRPTHLHQCHLLVVGTASAPAPSVQSTAPTIPTPPASPTTPQVPTPPVSPDMPSLANAPPTPPRGPTDAQVQPMGSPAVPNPLPDPASPSSPSPAQPCPHRLNPFNPLSAPPCMRAGQSGAPPPGATPAAQVPQNP